MPAARYLLDTSVFSQPIRKQPAPAVMEHWVRVGDAVCAVSVVSIAEVEWGLHKAAIPRWWNLYEQLLKSRLPILPTDRSVWTRFSRLNAAQLAAGRLRCCYAAGGELASTIWSNSQAPIPV